MVCACAVFVILTLLVLWTNSFVAGQARFPSEEENTSTDRPRHQAAVGWACWAVQWRRKGSLWRSLGRRTRSCQVKADWLFQRRLIKFERAPDQAYLFFLLSNIFLCLLFMFRDAVEMTKKEVKGLRREAEQIVKGMYVSFFASFAMTNVIELFFTQIQSGKKKRKKIYGSCGTKCAKISPPNNQLSPSHLCRNARTVSKVPGKWILLLRITPSPSPLLAWTQPTSMCTTVTRPTAMRTTTINMWPNPLPQTKYRRNQQQRQLPIVTTTIDTIMQIRHRWWTSCRPSVQLRNYGMLTCSYVCLFFICLFVLPLYALYKIIGPVGPGLIHSRAWFWHAFPFFPFAISFDHTCIY